MDHEPCEEKLRTRIGSGFCYSDFSSSTNSTFHQLENRMQGFEQPNSELFNLQSSSKTVAEASTDFYQPDCRRPDFVVGFSELAPDSAWQENRFQLGSLQSFELRETNRQIDTRFASSNSEDGYFGKSMDLPLQQQNFMGSSLQLHHQQLKNSKFLLPTQELLNEFSNLGIKQKHNSSCSVGTNNKFHKDGDYSKNHSLHSLDFLELQKRKAKLVSLLEEVNRRYRQYCEQMRTVVSSFEAVAGAGAANVYSRLALKAMSRHFRCLRDGIVGQIQVTQKAMGEKDAVALGTTKGETPRLKLLDQTLRQQKALQQMGMMECQPWRPQRGLPERSVSILRAWLFEHFLHPYPSDMDKHIMARQTGLSRSQVSNWFINARVRLWKPMVEEMYLEETKEQDNKASNGAQVLQDKSSRPNPQYCSQNPNPNTNHNNQLHPIDQKPSPDEQVHDPDYLSAIIGNSDKREREVGKGIQHQQAENFGMVDLDFSSYSHAPTSTVTYSNGDCAHPGFGNTVSLTLGLQRSGGGISLSFSPDSQHSLFFSRQEMEECPPMQYSILDGETQNLPYRNLMGEQLLHDLAA
ncbi:hypothetical protein AAC387_Pa08g0877 [Persea americana]